MTTPSMTKTPSARWMAPVDALELPLSTAALKICEMHDLGGQSIKYAPLP